MARESSIFKSRKSNGKISTNSATLATNGGDSEEEEEEESLISSTTLSKKNKSFGKKRKRMGGGGTGKLAKVAINIGMDTDTSEDSDSFKPPKKEVKIRRNKANVQLLGDSDVDDDKVKGDGDSEDDDSYDGLNLKRLVMKQRNQYQKKSGLDKQKSETVSEEPGEVLQETPKPKENPAEIDIYMGDSDNDGESQDVHDEEEIKVYDDTEIAKIKSQKLYLRNKQSEAQERKKIINSDAIDIEMSDSSSDEESEDSKEDQKLEGIAASDMIHNEPVEKMLEIESKLYEYNLDNIEEDEEVSRWEAQRIYNAITVPITNILSEEGKEQDKIWIDGASEKKEHRGHATNLGGGNLDEISRGDSLKENFEGIEVELNGNSKLQDIRNYQRAQLQKKELFDTFPKLSSDYQRIKQEMLAENDSFGGHLMKLEKLQEDLTNLREEKRNTVADLEYDFEDSKDQLDDIKERLQELFISFENK
ncbi:hypothetical protein DASC09_058440 [Saccharomycopsis crataegensis]|uniref:Uncharacterized protein n=1 Tax=Saccharomycopsis crataegensis TaxID=43959 RepID=A0AAV5QV80_9ASCO|nr:hypothetical protein DASC09_058440 [Saccharomycopsis crataegensis]